MGGRISSTCKTRTNGEIGCFGDKRANRTLADHVITLQHLASIPNRIFMNGKSRTSCIFTQQGRKGINQDAMIVWEVSNFYFFSVYVTCTSHFSWVWVFGVKVHNKIVERLTQWIERLVILINSTIYSTIFYWCEILPLIFLKSTGICLLQSPSFCVFINFI